MYQRGQSLLEMVITIGIAVAIVVALTVTTVKGLQSGQFAQNQVQAAKLAQEGIERMRSFRENDIPVRLNGVNYHWSASTLPATNIWHYPFDTSATCSDCHFEFQTCPGQDCYIRSIAPSNEGEALPGGVFHRRIKIEDFSPDNKKVTSIVNWSDYSGEHQSEVVTVLSNY